jgi:hypothetical protein
MRDPDIIANEIRELFRKADEAIKAVPRRNSVGEMLIEARSQLSHQEFYAWCKRHFKLTAPAVNQHMDEAYAARRMMARVKSNG